MNKIQENWIAILYIGLVALLGLQFYWSDREHKEIMQQLESLMPPPDSTPLKVLVRDAIIGENGIGSGDASDDGVDFDTMPAVRPWGDGPTTLKLTVLRDGDGKSLAPAAHEYIEVYCDTSQMCIDCVAWVWTDRDGYCEFNLDPGLYEVRTARDTVAVLLPNENAMAIVLGWGNDILTHRQRIIEDAVAKIWCDTLIESERNKLRRNTFLRKLDSINKSLRLKETF